MISKEVVASSWERSRKYGVKPDVNPDAILEQASFLHRREKHQTLLQTIGPSVLTLFTSLRDIQSTAIVADVDGYILSSIGDPTFMSDAEKVHLREGACWSESIRGTNAIGTAIVEHNPVTIVGEQHYCENNQFLCCSAVPLFHPSGEMAAVLDVSGYYEAFHPSQLALVEMAARNMEDWMLLQNREYHLVLSLHSTAAHRRRALIGIDLDGRIIGANREGRTMLQVTNLTERNLFLQEVLRDSHLLLSSHRQDHTELLRFHQPLDNNEFVEASVVLENRPYRTAPFSSQPNQTRTSASESVQEAPGTPPNIPGRATNSLSSKTSKTSEPWQTRYRFQDIFAHDPSLLTAVDLARRAARTDYTVLVYGETGTGKEMVSQAVHGESQRKTYPFVSLNCGAMSPTLIESELFGYESGAFTGAKNGGSKGKIELAHQGTLFLDEIAEMPPDMQTRMLRVLQEGYIVRIGGTKPIPVDVRIIAATHKDLWNEVQTGHFRADLFFRLQGIEINLPPLRHRTDLLELIHYLLPKVQRQLDLNALHLTGKAQQLLLSYSWPGNVRELESVLREAAFLAQSSTIETNHFPKRLQPSNLTLGPPADCVRHQKNSNGLRQYEHQMILQTLEESQGNLSEAARRLGISRSTLYRKLQDIEC